MGISRVGDSGDGLDSLNAGVAAGVAAHAHEQARELLTHGNFQVVTDTDNLRSNELSMKGCGPKFACFNDRPKACVNFEMRKLRCDLGRLKEAQRQTEAGSPAATNDCCRRCRP